MDNLIILLIGDEPMILRTLRRNLIGRGYEVFLALDDQEAYETVARTDVDLFILSLDFSTIHVDGLEICSRLRELTHAPIIVLSSIGSENTKVQALDLGADDYLVMPFSMEEFLARVRSALRRWMLLRDGSDCQDEIILAGDLVIDTEARQVQIRGEDVHLTPTEYDILIYLARRSGKAVTHRELLKAVWGSEYGNEREYLRVYISQIRRKIETNPLNPKFILTDPGIGYRFRNES